MKIGIFTGGTSARSKNVFTDISRYPTGKHEIISDNVQIESICIQQIECCSCYEFVADRVEKYKDIGTRRKCCLLCFIINSVPNDKSLDYIKLKAVADNKINVTQKLKLMMG